MRLQHLRTLVVIVGLLFLLPGSAAATKRQPGVTATWRGAPPTVPLGGPVQLILHLDATANATVTTELAPSAGVEVLSDGGPWTSTFLAGQVLDLPVTVRFTANGDTTLGANLTIRRQSPDGPFIETTSVALNTVAVNGIGTVSADSHTMIKMAAATSAESLRRLGIAAESAVASTSRPPSQSLPITSTMSGLAQWMDPEGHAHPVRRAYVEITNAATGALLTTTATSDTGTYSAGVTADSVKVTVFTRDFDNIRAVVFPVAQPTLRYVLESTATALTGGATTVNLTSDATVRGSARDSTNARAFAAYDAILTYWFQATALLGRNMQQALTNFDGNCGNSPTSPTSCYSDSNQQMYILRADAFDWDVLGHEFFHFTAGRGALRTLDSSQGGYHNGSSAIGQNTRQNGTGRVRGRDEGMTLAWSEGLATFMSLAIQQSPPSTFPFPTGLAGVADRMYTDTEDANITDDPERPSPNEGFGSEESVLGALWDLYDTAQDADGDVTDSFAGANPKLFWDAINTFLPCSPCDRIDKFWASLVSFFGATNSSTIGIAKIFVINQMAPKATAPADGTSVPGSVAPTFTWERRGDPSASHRNNSFKLLFSRDDFQSHVVTVNVPTADATSYKPTDAEWEQVQNGGNQGQTYKWMVLGTRSDAPVIPSAGSWYSNVKSLVPRSLEATITWTPVGADVDLHLANPGGSDIYYQNRTTSWGFLDRDCISDCAQEIISVTSLPFHGTYRLFAHYYSDHGRGPATVHARVRSGSQTLADVTFTLSTTGSTFTIVTTTADEPVTKVSADGGAIDPASLPPKGPQP